jgi:hypothetical protein
MDNSKLLKVGLILAGAAGIGYFIYKKFIVKPAVVPSSSTASSLTPTTASTPTSSGCVDCSTQEQAILSSPTTAQAQAIIDKIKADSNWYSSIVSKAKGKNITVEQQLKLDAVWVINHPNG